VEPPENPTYACAGVLVDELVRGGVTHLCLCPGSRSAPLALSAARHPGMRVWTLVDERCAGFFALGMARALGRPVAVLSTSGTAAANFFPAVIEAHYGRVPLLVLTADRPREVRDFGAAQTIDQVRLYGGHTNWFADLADAQATDEIVRYFRAVACRAIAAARGRPPGPVHLNVPLREPLAPAPRPQEMPSEARRAPAAWDGRPARNPYASADPQEPAPDTDRLRRLAADLLQTPRGVIVCGPQDDPGLGGAVGRLARAFRYPVLADPLSQVRSGPHDKAWVVDGYDAMLRIDELAERLAPDVILRLGGVPASRPLLRFLERHGRARYVVVDEQGWTDPTHLASDVVCAGPPRFCDLMAGPGAEAGGRPSSTWAAQWLRLAGLARRAVERRLAALDEPFEGKVFSELGALLPDGAALYVGNSMPVRDLDTFFPATDRAIRVLGNRGASGIDGLVSSALGLAAVHQGPVVLVLGDLAFYHDLNGLLAAKLHRLRATVVLLNNDGGGIFSFLPQADYPEHFEALFGTPTGLDFRAAAGLYGAGFARVDTWPAFRDGIRKGLEARNVTVLELPADRARNVELHHEVWAAADTALRPELALIARQEVS
jgi:2-succinyl-5-enolpyruvyl-6-hydroxy-3-cyclohexene-1-carboxylate synthase